MSAFQCLVETTIEPATNVHRLRPSDIKVVGALGDSLTAGYFHIYRWWFREFSLDYPNKLITALGSNAQSILGFLRIHLVYVY